MIFYKMTDTINVREEEVDHSLRTFSLLKGQPVFVTASGTKIGEVSDLLITSEGRVKGLLIKTCGFFKHTFFLDICHVSAFGGDGVMIDAEAQLEKLNNNPEYTIAHQHSLEGKMLLSQSGDALGLLKDVYFLEEMGTIVGYEVTAGFFSDLTEGKQVIESEKPPAIGKDAIVVDVNQT
jgi:uncharacterized protein YrrD